MGGWNKETLPGSYDYASFTLSNGASNYDVKANQSALFYLLPTARNIIIWTTRNVSIKFNNSLFPAIPLDAGESPVEFKHNFEVTNIFMANSSGNDATIKILTF